METKPQFIIENREYNNKEFQVILLKIGDKLYYLGTLKEYKEFCYIQTKSKKFVDKN